MRYFILLLAIHFVLPASAQDRPRDAAAPRATILPPHSPIPLTGKERLGEKWTDEQRIDNCNVPADKRGIRPRPGICH